MDKELITALIEVKPMITTILQDRLNPKLDMLAVVSQNPFTALNLRIQSLHPHTLNSPQYLCRMFNLPLYLPLPKISYSSSSLNSYRHRSNHCLRLLSLPSLQQLLQQPLPLLAPLLPSPLTLVLLTPTLLYTCLYTAKKQ
jgi:hypothetical protein